MATLETYEVKDDSEMCDNKMNITPFFLCFRKTTKYLFGLVCVVDMNNCLHGFLM